MARWPLVVVPGWAYLEPAFRDELAAYAKAGGRLLLIGPGPARLFERELAADPAAARIASVAAVDETFSNAVARLFPEPLVKVSGSTNVDLSVRRLGAGQEVTRGLSRVSPRENGTVPFAKVQIMEAIDPQESNVVEAWAFLRGNRAPAGRPCVITYLRRIRSAQEPAAFSVAL